MNVSLGGVMHYTPNRQCTVIQFLGLQCVYIYIRLKLLGLHLRSTNCCHFHLLCLYLWWCRACLLLWYACHCYLRCGPFFFIHFARSSVSHHMYSPDVVSVILWLLQYSYIVSWRYCSLYCTYIYRTSHVCPYLSKYKAVFLKRRAAARYRALASIIPSRERFSCILSLNFLSSFHE